VRIWDLDLLGVNVAEALAIIALLQTTTAVTTIPDLHLISLNP